LIEAIMASQIDLTVFFYNPNIYPQKEYERRKHEIMHYAMKLNVPFVDADYDTENWFARVKGLGSEPERGLRCSVCFEMRLERTALYAHEHGISVITSSLGISRFKDREQVNDCGVNTAARYKDMVYWTYNWRKNGGAVRMNEIAKREGFYQQKYCGCIYSLNDANRKADHAS